MASFLKTRIERRRPAPGESGEVAQPPPPPATWAPALTRAAADLLGAAQGPGTDPVALPHGYGPWIFALDLGADGDRPVVARLATDRAELDREVAAMAANRANGLATPDVLGVVELDLDVPTCALLTAPVTDVPLPELIGFNLHRSNDLLEGFAAHHDTIHRLPVDDLDAVPTVDAATEVARIDRSRYPAEVDWLDEHRPPTGDLVLCHGGYQPLAVFGPPAERWDEHGGPGRGLTVVNWGGAVLAEAEYDMAFTLVAFWSAPFFAPNRSERTAIKMIRNTLLNTYKQGYTARRSVDPERLRFWQVFHALRGLARIDGAYDDDGSPFAAADRGAVPLDLGPELHRHVRQLSRVR